MTGADILTLDTEAENVENDNTLYIVVPGKLNTGTAQTLDITLKEELPKVPALRKPTLT